MVMAADRDDATPPWDTDASGDTGDSDDSGCPFGRGFCPGPPAAVADESGEVAELGCFACFCGKTPDDGDSDGQEGR